MPEAAALSRTRLARLSADGAVRVAGTVADDPKARVAEGDLVAIHWTMTGTSTEAVAGPGGAGKAVAVDGISLFRYDDEGKVAESWDLVDRAGMLTQLGFQIRPPAAQSSD